MSVTWDAQLQAGVSSPIPHWMVQLEQPAGEEFASVVHEEVAAAAAQPHQAPSGAEPGPAAPKPGGQPNRKPSKFMIPEDSVQQLSFVLGRMDSLLQARSELAAHDHGSQLVLADGEDRVSGAYDTAVLQWGNEFAAIKAAESRRRQPLWDLSTLVNLARGSPSLQLCKDLDEQMLVLMHEISGLFVWRKDVFEQRLLPLEQFTHLSVVCSRLTRARGRLHALVSLLLSQVRALFVECSDEQALILHKELLVRRDNATTAHLEIERMYEANDYLRKELAASRAAEGWIRFALTLEFQLFEKATRMYKRDLTIYVEKLKERTNIKKILSMNASELGVEDDPDAPAGGKKKPKMLQVVQQQQKLLKHVEKKVTTYEEQVKLRENKLVHQQEKYREAVQEYEAGVEDLHKKTTIVNTRSAELDELKKKLESQQEAFEEVVKAAHKEFAEQQRAIAERFGVLGSLETDLSQRALAVSMHVLCIREYLRGHPAMDVDVGCLYTTICVATGFGDQTRVCVVVQVEAAAREQLVSLSKHAAAEVCIRLSVRKSLPTRVSPCSS